MDITKDRLAQMIEHTNLKAYATADDLRTLVDEACAYGFRTVVVNSGAVETCRSMLGDSPVALCATVGFPLGQTTVESKVFEAEQAVEQGCREFDYVLNVGRAREHDWAYIRDEMSRLVAVARRTGTCCKVIFETCYLADGEIEEIARIASEVKPDFIKTSTGFGTAGATVDHVRLMKRAVGDDVQVKAAGGIRDLDTALAMAEAGATRLGTSSGVQILRELETRTGA